jgi:uncharacterized protein (DUF2147 family)
MNTHKPLGSRALLFLRPFLWMSLLALCMTSWAGEGATGADSGAKGKAADSPIGRWKTFDEKTGKAKSIVRISEENGKLQGKIETLFREPGQDPDPVCDVCPEGKRGQKKRGMIILWDLTRNGEWWEGGRILDPANGKVYRCRMRTLESGHKLQVRGFIGVSMMGRSQVWEREP